MADECRCKEQIERLQHSQDVVGNFLWPTGREPSLLEFIERKATEAKDDRHIQDLRIEKLYGEIANLKSRGALVLTLVSLGLGILSITLKLIGN